MVARVDANSELRTTCGDVAASYAYCRRLCHRARSTFPFAFWLLPPPQRRAMQALYAFLRLSDDLADGPHCDQSMPASSSADALLQWRRDLERALRGEPTHPVHPALADAVNRFGIQPAWLFAVLDGVAQDLQPVHLRRFEQLYAYCWRVASAVGLACLAIWGLRRGVAWTQAEPLAVAAGIAFQLTNILRDLGEDLHRGRVYLPAEELESFGCPVECWSEPSCRPALAHMLRWQVERARTYYRLAAPLASFLPPRPRAVFRLMTMLYRQLLEQVAAAGPEILVRRVRLGHWRRWWCFLRACLAPPDAVEPFAVA